MATSTPRSGLSQLLHPFAGPLAVFSVALAGIALPFVVATTVGDSDRLSFAALPPLDAAKVMHGREVFSATCFTCHAADAKGIANLGKDLTTGFSRETSDSELVAMIMRGRQPGDPKHTSVAPMPPKGGREDLTRSDIANVVAYLRSIQDPSRLLQPLPPPAVAIAESVPTPAAPVEMRATAVMVEANESASEASVAFNPDSALRGKKVFNSCITCHGKTGVGVANLGADLVKSPFIASKTDEELAAFIKKGRMPTDPDTRLKLTMPPKGGNPALNDKQIADVVSYLRSLQATQSASR